MTHNVDMLVGNAEASCSSSNSWSGIISHDDTKGGKRTPAARSSSNNDNAAATE